MTSRTSGSEGGIEFLSNQDPVSYLTRALTIYEQQVGPTHPDTRIVRENYVRFLRALGRTAQADQVEARDGRRDDSQVE